MRLSDALHKWQGALPEDKRLQVRQLIVASAKTEARALPASTLGGATAPLPGAGGRAVQSGLQLVQLWSDFCAGPLKAYRERGAVYSSLAPGLSGGSCAQNTGTNSDLLEGSLALDMSGGCGDDEEGGDSEEFFDFEEFHASVQAAAAGTGSGEDNSVGAAGPFLDDILGDADVEVSSAIGVDEGANHNDDQWDEWDNLGSL